MKTKIAIASLVSTYLVFWIPVVHAESIMDVLLKEMTTSSVAHAESIDVFLKRTALGSINSNDLHHNGKHILLVGGETISLDASQLLNLVQKVKSMGTKAEILDFKILSKHETGDIVSVVVKAKVRSQTGASETVG